MVARRVCTDVFGATEKRTTPSPVPVSGGDRVTQSAFFVALQEQVAGPLTSIDPVPPSDANVPVWGSIPNSHPAAACDRMKPVFPTVIVVVRGTFWEFAATPNDTVPFPAPLDPAVMTTQSTVLCAVHVQPVPVVTVKVPAPPFTGNVLCGGVNVYRHAALWVTMKV